MAKAFYGDFLIKGNKALQLEDGDSDVISLKAPANIDANRTITFPGTASAEHQLMIATDTVGTLEYSLLDDDNIAGSAGILESKLALDFATSTLNTNIGANTSDIADIRTTQGTSDGDTDLGTFSGSIISDTTSVKTALQELENAIESGTGIAGATSLEAQLVSTSNLALSGEQTIDGTLTSTSRVLLTGQTAPAENGIYVTAAGAWARSGDLDASADFEIGRLIVVREGTAKGDTIWANQATVATVDTTAVDIDQVIDPQVSTNTTGISDNTSDIADIRTTQGTSDGDTDMGTYTGTVLTDNTTVKANIQELGTQVDTNTTHSTGDGSDHQDVADVVTLSGSAANSTNHGVFSGSTLSDTETTRSALQALETAVETKADSSTVTEIDGNVDDLITLSGVAENSTDLGTFSGTTITNSSTVKTALQELETALEAVDSAGQFAASWTSGTTITLTHSLSTEDVIVQVWDKDTNQMIGVDEIELGDGGGLNLDTKVTLTSSENVTSAAPTNGWRVVVMGV
jgi:hypothetical protein